MEVKGYRKALPVIRQLPGKKNELGKIKFLFPSSQYIYFHDTPHKWFFSQDVRAYSHGCIRLAEPEKLANFLLAGDGSWTTEKIDSVMNSDEEKSVALSKPVPVLITILLPGWMNQVLFSSGTISMTITWNLREGCSIKLSGTMHISVNPKTTALEPQNAFNNFIRNCDWCCTEPNLGAFQVRYAAEWLEKAQWLLRDLLTG